MQGLYECVDLEFILPTLTIYEELWIEVNFIHMFCEVIEGNADDNRDVQFCNF
jgi:hypothetical protein